MRSESRGWISGEVERISTTLKLIKKMIRRQMILHKVTMKQIFKWFRSKRKKKRIWRKRLKRKRLNRLNSLTLVRSNLEKKSRKKLNKIKRNSMRKNGNKKNSIVSKKQLKTQMLNDLRNKLNRRNNLKMRWRKKSKNNLIKSGRRFKKQLLHPLSPDKNTKKLKKTDKRRLRMNRID